MDQPHAPDAEALRRRLYGPAATEDDVARYLAAAPPEATDGPVPSAEPSPGPPRIRRVLGVAAGLVAVAAVAVLVPAVQGAAPTASPSPTQTVVVLPTDQPDVVYADAGTVLTYRGEGSRTVQLDASLAPRTGSMTVLVDPSRPVSISWYALRSAAATSGVPDRIRLRPDRDSRSGDDVPLQLDYADGPPDQVVVTAPAGAGWTLVVTFLRARSPA